MNRFYRQTGGGSGWEQGNQVGRKWDVGKGYRETCLEMGGILEVLGKECRGNFLESLRVMMLMVIPSYGG